MSIWSLSPMEIKRDLGRCGEPGRDSRDTQKREGRGEAIFLPE